MDFQLKDKVVIVTGGTRGIGRAITEDLLNEGANVVAVYHTDDAAANELKRANSEYCDNNALACISCDITAGMQQHELLDSVQSSFGSAYGLVNNAGGKLKVTTERFGDIAEMVMLNSIAPIELAIRMVSHVDATIGGSIVNILSVLKDVYYPEKNHSADMAHYGASKAYLETAGRLLAPHLSEANVRINSVSPGPTRGGGLSANDAVHNDRLAHGQYMMKRRTELSDVVNAVLYLLSPLSSQITGQTINVDGGQTIPPFFYPLTLCATTT